MRSPAAGTTHATVPPAARSAAAMAVMFGTTPRQ